MGKPLNFVSIDTILNKVSRDLGITDIPKSDLINWAAEALAFIDANDYSEQAVAFIEVKNHIAELPYGLKQIIQVARNHNYKNNKKILCPVEIEYDNEIEELQECNECKPKCEGVPLDCNGNPITGDDKAYYRPHWSISYNNKQWKFSKIYNNNYTPVKLSNHTFFNTLVCYEDSEIYSSNMDEYTIMGNSLRLSFKEGSIAVSYYRTLLDKETGYPLIPDDISFTTAIIKYITMMWANKQNIQGRQGYEKIANKAQQDWHWYCNQASTKSFALYGADEHQNFFENRGKLLKQRDSYYKFFGNFNNINL